MTVEAPAGRMTRVPVGSYRPGPSQKGIILTAKALLELIVGVCLFSLLHFLATKSSSMWLSFPLFCAAMVALGSAGTIIRRECDLD